MVIDMKTRAVTQDAPNRSAILAEIQELTKLRDNIGLMLDHAVEQFRATFGSDA